MSRRRPLRLLSIAGSDPTAGAGAQADLKTFAAHGAYGLSVLTAITVQSPNRVAALQAISPDLVEHQFRCVLESIGIDGVKTGMLADARTARRVAACIGDVRQEVPLVVDPVVKASDGTPLLDEEGVEVLRDELLPLASVVTPNRTEAGLLLGREVNGRRASEHAALELAELGCAVLLTGGDQVGEEVVDLLATGTELVRYRKPRLPVASRHGTGCALSAALAAELAAGKELSRAAAHAIEYVRRAMYPGLELASGAALLDHATGALAIDTARLRHEDGATGGGPSGVEGYNPRRGVER